jgi:hypothetical protein
MTAARSKRLSADRLEDLGKALLGFNTLADLKDWLRTQ